MAIDQTWLAGVCAAFEDGVRERDFQKAADILWPVWTDLWRVVTQEGIRSEKEAIKRIHWQFGNWANDTNDALGNARRYADEITLCENILEMEWDSPLFHENARRSIADCHALLGDTGKALELYAAYLREDPHWGWGWIGYLRQLEESGDARLLSVMSALRERLASDTEMRDAEDVWEELGIIYGDHGVPEESNRCFEIGSALMKAKSRLHAHPEHNTRISSADAQGGGTGASKGAKVGRNDPCPCGSGKKYKKCCGQNPS